MLASCCQSKCVYRCHPTVTTVYFSHLLCWDLKTHWRANIMNIHTYTHTHTLGPFVTMAGSLEQLCDNGFASSLTLRYRAFIKLRCASFELSHMQIVLSASSALSFRPIASEIASGCLLELLMVPVMLQKQYSNIWKRGLQKYVFLSERLVILFYSQFKYLNILKTWSIHRSSKKGEKSRLIEFWPIPNSW